MLDTHKMLKAGHGSMRHSGTASFLRHSMFRINPSELDLFIYLFIYL